MFVHKKSPTPSLWLKMNNDERNKAINDCLKDKEIKDLVLEDFNDNGHIVFKIVNNIPVDKRGLFLIEFENYLKNKIDKSLTLWCTAQGDKSKLRNLRGLEIKI